MRHRLPLLAASIGLILGGTLAAAYPAAATTNQATGGMVQPGGLMELSNGTRPAVGIPQVARTTVTSSNWAGYAATGSNGPFNSVSADWVQPAGNCSGGGDQYSAFWVGLDGYSSSTVEQTGSEVDCVGRTAEYYAWYEMYPGPSENYSNTVRAGDHFNATVTWLGGDKFSLYIADTTQGWSHTTDASLTSTPARSSAEVIVEAPCCTNSGGIMPLTDLR